MTAQIGDNRPKAKFLKAVAMDLMDKREIDKLRLRRKARRKLAEKNGVELAFMDKAVKMAEMTQQERAIYFKTLFQYMGYLNCIPEVEESQLDFFSDETDWYMEGQYAGLQGFDGKAPEHLSQADQQLWLQGWGEGQAALADGLEEDKERAATKADETEQSPPGPAAAPKPKAKKPTAKEVAAKAKEQFEADEKERLAKEGGDGGGDETNGKPEGEPTQSQSEKAAKVRAEVGLH